MRSAPFGALLLVSLVTWIGPRNAAWADSKAASAPAAIPSTAPSQPAPDPQFHVNMPDTITYLASDELEGRMIGTPGIQRAADLIASDFSKLGLKTLPGLDGYFQSFELTTSIEPNAGESMLAFGNQTLRPGNQMVPLRFSAEKTVEAPLVFAGYGEAIPTAHYDDYAKLDVKGKIVLVMRFEVADPATGKSRFADAKQDYSPRATLQAKLNEAMSHGAAGIIFVNPANYHGNEGLVPFSRMEMFKGGIPAVQVTQAVADEMLKAGGAPDLLTLQKQIDDAGKFEPVALKPVDVKISVKFERTRKKVENVVGILPGKGPNAGEYVVVCAHYDHLGHGGRFSLMPWSHAVHHGADDNASGTTCVVELADKFTHEFPPARSLIFITFTGEEEGLLGSEYFVEHPPMPLEKIVGVLNMDMVGRVKNQKLLVGGMGTAAAFPDILKTADADVGLKLGEFGKGGIGPSDHMSFAMKKIPVLFFYDDMMIDYHRPTDTADKINFEGMEEVVKLAQHVVTSMTMMPRQKYNGAYDAQGMAQSGVSHGSRVSLGVVPDYSQGEEGSPGGGVRITGTVAGSAAEKAGLKDGDVILQFADKKIDNLMDLSNALAEGKAGQRVTLKIKRDGKPMEVQATLTERK